MVDFFSRNFQGMSADATSTYLIWRCISYIPSNSPKLTTNNLSANVISRLSVKPELISELKNIKDRQLEDETMKALQAKTNSKLQLRVENDVMHVRHEKIMHWKLFLPAAMVTSTLRLPREQLGHVGASKLYDYLDNFFGNDACAVM